MRRALVVAGAIAMLFSGCAHRKRVRTVPAPVPRPVGYTEDGIASWYGYPYHGRPAANGEIYDQEQYTAAHRTLPFNTVVAVRDLETHKTVDVRITDRGPFVDGRIIDLSRAAARSIGMLGPGTARVRLTVIQEPSDIAPPHFAVQVGAFRERDNAERLRSEMQKQYGTARLILRDGNPALWRVLVGVEPSEEDANALARRIRSDRKMAVFVVRVDPETGPVAN